MLRQDEVRSWRGRNGPARHLGRGPSGRPFERALEVAASVAAALVDDGPASASSPPAGTRWSSTGPAPGRPAGIGASVGPPSLEHLALVAPDAGGADAFALAVQSIRHQPSGPLAAVVADASPAEVSPRRPPLPALGLVLIARCEQEGPEAPDGVPAHSAAGAVIVSRSCRRRLCRPWNQAVRLVPARRGAADNGVCRPLALTAVSVSAGAGCARLFGDATAGSCLSSPPSVAPTSSGS